MLPWFQRRTYRTFENKDGVLRKWPHCTCCYGYRQDASMRGVAWRSVACDMDQNRMILRQLIIHFPTSSGVSEWAYEWAQRSVWAKRAVWNKQTSEWTKKWPSKYISIHGCSEPQWRLRGTWWNPSSRTKLAFYAWERLFSFFPQTLSQSPSRFLSFLVAEDNIYFRQSLPLFWRRGGGASRLRRVDH